jgi:hypothetical protein
VVGTVDAGWPNTTYVPGAVLEGTGLADEAVDAPVVDPRVAS